MTDDTEELDNELEKEFLQAYNDVHAEIQENLRQASLLIDKAVALAESRGVPFVPKFPLCSFTMSYIPQSYREKFSKLDTNFVHDLTDAHGYWKDYGGWQTSQTC